MGTHASIRVSLRGIVSELVISLVGTAQARLNIRKALQALGGTLAMLLLSLAAFSQGSAGRVVGTVTDANGGTIAGASVTILDVQRGTSRPLTTDESGAYSAPNLVPGAYKVRVEYKGFKTTERQNIILEVGQEIRVDLTLQPGEQTQTITVTEQIPLVETTNAELGGTLQNEVINDLPLNGRNFENLLDLRPGVTKYVGNSGWTQSSNGLRPHDNFFMVDGINSNDPWMAQSVMNAVMAAGDAGTMLPIDAIDEFKTQQNPRAEYGWKPGAVVNVGVKSGTNTIHGSAYAYGRSDGFDARNFFEVGTNPKVPLSLKQFGGSVGGPIKRDKLFYFANFEDQQYSVGNPVQHIVPITNTSSTDAKFGLVAACSAVAPANRRALSLRLAGLDANCSPLSNYPGLFPVNNGASTTLNTALNSVNQIYSGVGKIDYHINEKHSLSGMYFISPGDGTFVDAPTTQIDPQWLTVQHARSQVASVGWTYVPNSKWVNSFRFGYSHYYQVFNSADGSQDPANYTYKNTTYQIFTGQNNPLYRGLPAIQWQGGYSFTLGASWPKTVGPDGIWQFSDSVSYLRGNHSFKFGGEVLVMQSTNNVTANTKGPVRFGNTSGGPPALQNFFSGNMNRALFTSGNLLRHLQNEGYALFLQDDWRVTPRLTMNLGIRYELNTVVKEKNNLMGNFDMTKGLIQQSGSSGVYNGDHNNFAPRFGFAWDMGGNGKTVIRGGGSVLYEQGSYDSLMAIGNLLGLRTTPTGVNFYTGGNATPTTAGGTINVGQIQFTGGALGNAATAGTVKYNWANNSASIPLYAASPACGDGVAVAGVRPTPQPCLILGVDRNLRTPYITTWTLGIQRALSNNLSLEVAYVGNHATKLVGMIDLNQPQSIGGFSPGWGDPAVAGTAANNCILSANHPKPYDNCAPDGAAETNARPFQRAFPYLRYIMWLSNNNFSNYNGLQVSMTQRATHGLSYVLGYTYAHALAESPDNWRFLVPVDNKNVRSLYGTTQFDVTHRFTFSTTYAVPGVNAPAQLLKGWSLNSIVTLQSGLPWGINDASTDFTGTGEFNAQNTNGEQWDFFGNRSDFKTTKAFINTNPDSQGNPTGGIPYFPGTTNATCLAKSTAMGQLAVASLTNLGCYAVGNSVLVPPAYGSSGTVGPNFFRSSPYYNLDLSVTKAFKFKERLTAQFRVEFFNILNRPNISNPYGGPGGDNTYTDPSASAGKGSFGFRPQTPDVTSSNPVLGSGGPRAMQLGLKLLF
jgi:hypothetical protein